jgi:hypothetical protein
MREVIDETITRPPEPDGRRYNRLLIATSSPTRYGDVGVVIAYSSASSGLVPVTRGYPPLSSAERAAVHRRLRPRLQNATVPYGAPGSTISCRLDQRHRSRRPWRDLTLCVPAYCVGAETRGAYEVSQLVWALFLGLNVALTCLP